MSTQRSTRSSAISTTRRPRCAAAAAPTATTSSTCCATSASRCAAFNQGYGRDISVTPGPQLRRRDQGLRRLGRRSTRISAAPTLTSITAYREYRSGQAVRHRLWRGRHPLPRAERRRLSPVPHLHAGTAPAGRGLRRHARLAGRRLLRRREADRARQPALRHPVRPLRHLPHHLGRRLGRPLFADQPGMRAFPASARRRWRVQAGPRARTSSPAFTALDSLNDRGIDQRSLLPEGPQLGAVHAQHRPHHRQARSDAGRALHQRQEELRRRPSPTTTPSARTMQGLLLDDLTSPNATRRAALAGALIGLGCQGNSTAELNGVIDQRQPQRGRVDRHRDPVVQGRPTTCWSMRAIRAATRRAASTSIARRSSRRSCHGVPTATSPRPAVRRRWSATCSSIPNWSTATNSARSIATGPFSAERDRRSARTSATSSSTPSTARCSSCRPSTAVG